MDVNIKKWSTQIKKGYLELCTLNLIELHGRLYGFQLIKLLEDCGIPIKEGTLYPLLNRLTTDKLLKSSWETKEVKGHPRKFYSLSKTGSAMLDEMNLEFQTMYKNYNNMNNAGGNNVE